MMYILASGSQCLPSAVYAGITEMVPAQARVSKYVVMMSRRHSSTMLHIDDG
jgi:hypothetical protein